MLQSGVMDHVSVYGPRVYLPCGWVNFADNTFTYTIDRHILLTSLLKVSEFDCYYLIGDYPHARFRCCE